MNISNFAATSNSVVKGKMEFNLITIEVDVPQKSKLAFEPRT